MTEFTDPRETGSAPSPTPIHVPLARRAAALRKSLPLGFGFTKVTYPKEEFTLKRGPFSELDDWL